MAAHDCTWLHMEFVLIFAQLTAENYDSFAARGVCWHLLADSG